MLLLIERRFRSRSILSLSTHDASSKITSLKIFLSLTVTYVVLVYSEEICITRSLW